MGTQPPAKADVCDACGGELYQRTDDKAETIKERLQVYTRQTAALIKYYRDQGLLREIPGGASVEQVGRKVREALAGVSGRRI